ncbi:MAG TPA: sialidase family protein [Cytophagaceae bacterium]
MKATIYLSLISSLFLYSCQSTDNKQVNIADATFTILSDPENDATTPLTGQYVDGSTFIYWIEKDSVTNKNIVAFSFADERTNKFGDRMYVPATIGCNDGHGQGMPRIAFKKDGTMIVVYHVRIPTEKSSYAGKIFYTMSTDKGITWTPPTIIHNDTLPDHSHGFPALSRLPNGEVAAIWLDGRNKLPHSELYMAQTKEGQGFQETGKIGGPACQCCKLEMYLDQQNKLHVLYRGIGDSSIRDIMHIYTDSTGAFSGPEKISNDGWMIKGCPHAGPGMLQVKDTLHYAWYTLGNGKGIYHTTSDLNATTYTKRRSIAANEFAKYPQLSQLNNGDLAIVWQEYTKSESTGYNRIMMEQHSKNGITVHTLTREEDDASHPILTTIGNKDILLYEKTVNGKSVVGYKEIKTSF